MDEWTARAICEHVFGDWIDVLASERSTPLLVLAVSHGDDVGALHVITRESAQLTDDVLASFLYRALDLLRSGRVTRSRPD